ncbi:MAG: anthranilate synthase component I family protein, partial [Candidatus Brocadiae bacterium]|nr:anthranilate synthase component I family protein [Candidatus Brocadiia bacterium]
VVRIEEGGAVRVRRGDPLDALRQFLDDRLPRKRALARVPAAVACLSYDLGRSIERLPSRARDDQRFPELFVAVHARILELEHDTGRIREHRLGVRPAAPQAGPAPPSPGRFRVSPRPPLVSRAAFIRAVARAVTYIHAGDIFQVNLSRRFEARVSGTPRELWARLRAASPAPYAAWLDLGGGLHVLSSSPESFLHVRGRRVTTRPIKGTRPRGRTAAADARLRADLLGSAKDRAELAMIVDLMRNDLGRVCRAGSVRVEDARRLESYPQVHHGVATVSGMLAKGVDAVDLIRATFPGGSITGAPRVRAMEIIEELEPARRSIYTGAVGWIARDALELSIAIRTLLLDGSRATWQVGAGIVAESDPREEERETRAKAAGIERALGLAGGDAARRGC